MEAEKTDKRMPLWKMLLLIVLLVAAVELMFLLIDYLMEPVRSAQREASPATGISETLETPEEGPSFCPHCGKAMREGFAWGEYCPYCGRLVE